jgi:hypothetical protein
LVELEALLEASLFLRSSVLPGTLPPGFTFTLPLALPLTPGPCFDVLELLLELSATRGGFSRVVLLLELDAPGAFDAPGPGGGLLTLRSQPASARASAVAPAIMANL